jgi:hypothetical protein
MTSNLTKMKLSLASNLVKMKLSLGLTLLSIVPGSKPPTWQWNGGMMVCIIFIQYSNHGWPHLSVAHRLLFGHELLIEIDFSIFWLWVLIETTACFQLIEHYYLRP